jgi:hypothetical protein
MAGYCDLLAGFLAGGYIKRDHRQNQAENYLGSHFTGF